ncbi:hypothetical protein [Subtercola endophyticus]|uniref:hypothetical protein n=1 Tax=Subtercola endophyticus TaxID=2895559 RepID=UPI001E42576C|nr:hypothetical protein [Subtercola endophyticus]UFS58454.1 hypothetical protein LQ955_15825 [Subtercola endophyticus]
MTRRHAGSGSVTVTGIARTHRTASAGSASRAGLTRGASALSIAAVAVLLAGCATSDDGVVLEGADGNNYVVPDGAERPQYATREDCIADVTEQIAKLQAEGESIGDDPNTLCEESSRYPVGHVGNPRYTNRLSSGSGGSSVTVWFA